MAYFLTIRRRGSLVSIGCELNVDNRIVVVDRAAGSNVIINTPDLAPPSGKFPVYERVAGATSPIPVPFTSALDGTIIEEFIEGTTPGDANTATRGRIRDGEPWLIRARLTNLDGQPYAYNSFTTLVVQVFDISKGSTNVFSATAPVLAVVVQPSLMDWDVDEYGYNVLLTILPADLTGSIEGGHVYRAELNFTLNTGGSKLVASEVVCSSGLSV